MEPKDYQDMYGALARRINGGNKYNSLLDRLKEEFESKRILTIKNFDKLKGAHYQYTDSRWSVDYVEETSTSYFFGLSKRNTPAKIEVRIGLNRVPMAGHNVEMYNLYNESYEGWVGVGKPIIRNPDSLMAKMIELIELPF